MSAPVDASPFSASRRFAGSHLHLGVTGSVACYKAAELLRAWLKAGIHVSATLTGGARHFLAPALFRALGALPVYDEMFADADAVFAHLEPGQLGGALLVAPASASCLARLARGEASDMLSAQALAFRGGKVVAPAMNPAMWENPATQANLAALAGFGWTVIPPAAGLVADGDTGIGRLAPLPEIFLGGLKALSPQDMAGIKVLVTLGPTREAWDCARFWSNASSGRMGCSLATAAWLRGADVTAVCGPGVSAWFPGGIRRVNVETAAQMLAAAGDVWPDMDMGFFCAAVADYSPMGGPGKEKKFKKAAEKLRIDFQPNADILLTLAKARRKGQKVLGFAAEATRDPQELLALALLKLHRKGADLIAANCIGGEAGAMGAATASMAVADANGRQEIWTSQPKADIAWELCSWLLHM